MIAEISYQILRIAEEESARLRSPPEHRPSRTAHKPSRNPAGGSSRQSLLAAVMVSIDSGGRTAAGGAG
jgi:hypothetical protein